jgi:hypothetical protein
MYQGETYRHIHYCHNVAQQHNATFFCSDVVCHYWAFAGKVGQLLPEFRQMTEGMKPFLSRFHGKNHGWQCQASFFSFNHVSFRWI